MRVSLVGCYEMNCTVQSCHIDRAHRKRQAICFVLSVLVHLTVLETNQCTTNHIYPVLCISQAKVLRETLHIFNQNKLNTK